MSDKSEFHPTIVGKAKFTVTKPDETSSYNPLLDDENLVEAQAAVLAMTEAPTMHAQIVWLAPVRGSDTETWLTAWRDKFPEPQKYWGEADQIWNTINEMLDDYWRHADTNTRLIFEVSKE